MYPITYEADAGLEGRDRLTTFFRSIVAIPWQIVQYLYGIAAQIAAVIAWFAIVFTGRYPEGIYNFNAGYLRMSTRTNSLYYLMTDAWPPFGGEEAPGYPVRVGIAPPLDQYSRAKAFFRLLLAIPVLLLGIVHALILLVCVVIAWFVILFTGRLPDGLFNPMRNAMTYFTRLTAYLLLMTEGWPPFSAEAGDTFTVRQIDREAASRRS
jgi:hypothetical protein